MAAAQYTSAYRCFLPDLAGLGGVYSHGSWRRAIHGITHKAPDQAFLPEIQLVL